MRKMKRFLSLMLATVLLLVASISVSADTTDYTITITNSVTGKTYTAYKVFDATYAEEDTETETGTGTETETGTETTKTVSYTIKSTSEWYNLVSGTTKVTDDGTTTGTVIESPFKLTQTTTSGTYTVTLKDGMSATSVANWFNAITETQLTEAGILAAQTGTGNGGSLKLDVTSAGAGYYYISTTTGTTVTVTTVAPTAEVKDKNQEPGKDLDKTVSDTKAQIGDTVTYTITSSVPAYNGETEITNYTFEDKLSEGLTAPDADNITVKILDASGNVYAYLTNTLYSGSISVSGQTITVTYDPRSITVATQAEQGDTLSTATSYPADATIEITYTATVNSDAAYKNGNTVKQTWEPYSDGITNTEYVYTYGFNLVKVANDTDSTQLADAEFQLTVKGNSTPIGFVKTTDSQTGNVTYTVCTDANTTGYTTTIISVAKGTITIFGLDAETTYTLTETKAPDGYNLASAVDVTVGQSGNYNETTGINTNTTTVVDVAGTELPSSGGMGTTILYIIGGILVIGAAILLITRRRMSQTR